MDQVQVSQMDSLPTSNAQVMGTWVRTDQTMVSAQAFDLITGNDSSITMALARGSNTMTSGGAYCSSFTFRKVSILHLPSM